jgi:hypothetical protein
MDIYIHNLEQSAVAEEGPGFAALALTARRQLSALQTALSKIDFSRPGAAQAEAPRREKTTAR